MCATCGCSDGAEPRVIGLASPESEHGHDHGHGHGHRSEFESDRTVRLEEQILAKNDLLAARNRGWFEGREIMAVNLMSSPGSGKTTLLERTIRELGAELTITVIEGDQATVRDADRISATGARVVQVNTGSGCHLDAEMLAGALRELAPAAGSVLFVENVGNLVCPALFDLGEGSRAVLVSTTEGADKPLKYPHMFRSADLVLLNKTDLLPYLDFDLAEFLDAVRRTNPSAQVLQVSATHGDGLDTWYEWLRSHHTTPVGA